MYVASQYASIYPIKIDDTFLIPLRRPNSRRPLIIQTLPSQGQSVSISTYLPVQVPSGRPRQSVEARYQKRPNYKRMITRRIRCIITFAGLCEPRRYSPILVAMVRPSKIVDPDKTLQREHQSSSHFRHITDVLHRFGPYT